MNSPLINGISTKLTTHIILLPNSNNKQTVWLMELIDIPIIKRIFRCYIFRRITITLRKFFQMRSVIIVIVCIHMLNYDII